MTAPVYARRIARLPSVFEELAAHPDGVPISDLATRLGVPVGELREDLLAFFTADVNGLLGLTRPSVLEFLGADGGEDDPQQAETVRLVDDRPTEELGVEYVDAAELALIYTAARALLDVDPDDADLAAAISVLTETLFGEAAEPAPAELRDQPLEPLRLAATERRKARISYSRTWEAGVFERDIDPYRLVQTRRGWEVDAGPPDAEGRLRTYLLSNIREVELLEEAFEPPSDLAERLEAQRTTERVRVRLPHTARWAADMYAERATAVTEDEDTVTLDLDLLPPLGRRVGMLLLASGPDAAVLQPAGLVAEARALAGELLAHHRG